jgi:hypothetical protein|nr:MAG TPA: hypothetical protein [Caudoviricetes sp.]
MKGGIICNKIKSHIFVFLGHSLEIQWVFLFDEKNIVCYGIDRILIIFIFLEENFMATLIILGLVCSFAGGVLSAIGNKKQQRKMVREEVKKIYIHGLKKK